MAYVDSTFTVFSRISVPSIAQSMPSVLMYLAGAYMVPATNCSIFSIFSADALNG